MCRVCCVKQQHISSDFHNRNTVLESHGVGLGGWTCDFPPQEKFRQGRSRACGAAAPPLPHSCMQKPLAPTQSPKEALATAKATTSSVDVSAFRARI